MNIGTAFWVLVLVALVFGFVGHFYFAGSGWAPLINNVLLFALILLLGWRCFGPMLKG